MTNIDSKQHGFYYRTVKGGKVKVFGNYYKPREGVQTMPEDGDKIMIYKYVYEDRFIGEHSPCPPDPDGYLRRMFWDRVQTEDGD